MAKTRTGVGKLLHSIIQAIGSIFQHSLTGAEKDYNNLSPEDQAALLHGAGVMTFIGQELDKEPAVIRQEIMAEFPDLDEAKLEKGLYAYAHALNLAPEENNLDDTIAKLKAHFMTLQGTVWNQIIQAGAAVVAFFVAPADSKISAAVDLVKYVYLTFFKKDKP